MKFYIFVLFALLFLTIHLFGQESPPLKSVVYGGYSWVPDESDKYVDVGFNSNYSILDYFYGFYDLNLKIGLKDNKVSYLININPGLTLFLLNKSELFVKIDLGAGPSGVKPFDKKLEIGISSLMRISLGYKSFGIYSQANFFQSNNGSFQTATFGILYKF